MAGRAFDEFFATHYDELARTLAVARGEYRVADEPRVWFTSTESFAKVLSAGNRELLSKVRRYGLQKI